MNQSKQGNAHPCDPCPTIPLTVTSIVAASRPVEVDSKQKAWMGQMGTLLVFVWALLFCTLKKDKRTQLHQDFALIILAFPFIFFTLSSRMSMFFPVQTQ